MDQRRPRRSYRLFYPLGLDPEFLKEHFLPDVVMLHVGTALALLVFFRQEWISLIRSIFAAKDKASRRLLCLGLTGDFF